MPESRQKLKVPELLVFIRISALWFILAGCFRIAYYAGQQSLPLLSGVACTFQAVGIIVCLIVCLAYAWMRDVKSTISRLLRSYRFDIFAFAIIGVWSNYLASPWLLKVQPVIDGIDPRWIPTILIALFLMLLSSIFRGYWILKKPPPSQFHFFGDDAIKTENENTLQNNELARNFAETVLASRAHSGLVFGIDAPWGIGKTSFVNLAERYWKKAGGDSVIVFRFEPLRYAAEPDLSERFLRDLTAAIQQQVYAPEFLPAASRYSRMIKSISLFGFRLSIEPLNETIDELMEDIDDVLKSIRRRIIVVIDDLDRLEPKTVNNVLFAVRRTFNLSQATYILCYDTENLVKGKDDGSNAREFLEKFVTVKLSLFVDSAMLRDFLKTDWRKNEHSIPTIPIENLNKLEAVLSKLAEILDWDFAPNYFPLIGDMRKLKRFVNAVLMMQIEKSDLSKTDFNVHDLVNLMLLHLNYPGVFRHIYAEETEGRQGIFSAKRSIEAGTATFFNNEKFEQVLKEYDATASFLLKQLFDVEVLNLGKIDLANESLLSSRACFNMAPFRNLEKYLKLIVRLAKPEQRDTFKFYQDAVNRVKNGNSVDAILKEVEFNLQKGGSAHEKFWQVLVNQSYELTKDPAKDAINTLVKYLPRYSSIPDSGEYISLRKSTILSLIYLLDRAGWGRTQGRRLENTKENILEIAERIYGEGNFKNEGLIRRLASAKRGTLGWHDLMQFRLHCSADRLGQTRNLQSALIVHDDINAQTDGMVSTLALKGMRTISQSVFKLFKETYIERNINFFTEVDNTPDHEFYGDSEQWLKAQSLQVEDGNRLEDQLLATRSAIKSFVIYQLANREDGHGSGVGVGVYDESGTGNLSGISSIMNDYIFDLCFNPLVDEDNIYHFTDHCLRNLSSGFFGADQDVKGYAATGKSLSTGLIPEKLHEYWKNHGPYIKGRNLQNKEMPVFTFNYVATYTEHLPKVFEVLDKMTAAPPKNNE